MLEKILKECVWLQNGLYLPDTSKFDIYYVYDFVHEMVADNHLPVTKVIGYKIMSSKTMSAKVSAVERNSAVMENFVEIATNLRDKVFLNIVDDSVVISTSGRFNLENPECIFRQSNKEVETYYVKPHVVSSVFPILMEVKVRTATGYKDIGSNVRVLKEDNSYFPMSSVHSLNDYVRVCPPKKPDLLEIRTDHGFTVEALRQHVLRLYSDSLAGKLERGDSKWLSDFAL